MAEYQKFMDSIKEKSDSTKKNYKVQYNKLFKLIGKPIAETSEKKNNRNIR
jgi:hypothetical protein